MIRALLLLAWSAMAIGAPLDVRVAFQRVGEADLRYLEATAAGRALVSRGLPVDQLRAALASDRIVLVDGPLRDNGGSEVDAIGEPGRITLKEQAWRAHFTNGRDVYYLVFHEMLRSIGRNDDNYPWSEGLYPFPAHLKTTLLPQTDGESTKDLPHPERRRYLLERCRRLQRQIAVATFGDYERLRDLDPVAYQRFHDRDVYWKKESLDILASLDRNVSAYVPETVPPGDPKEIEYRAALNSFERTMNGLQKAWGP